MERKGQRERRKPRLDRGSKEDGRVDRRAARKEREWTEGARKEGEWTEGWLGGRIDGRVARTEGGGERSEGWQ